jgi:membrane-bound metal-dependent hydrolase YbcI (DUF457 family)
MLGAAVAMPLAVPLSPGLALGAVFWGTVGGGFPDWVDLRSEWRKPLRLRHRGASHGLPFAILAAIGVYLMLRIVAGTTFPVAGYDLRLPHAAVEPWAVAFALGVLSHLIADAWTYAGIRPFLPFAQWRFWVVPKVLRGTSNGPLDFLARFLAMLGILAGVVAWAVAHA